MSFWRPGRERMNENFPIGERGSKGGPLLALDGDGEMIEGQGVTAVYRAPSAARFHVVNRGQSRRDSVLESKG